MVAAAAASPAISELVVVVHGMARNNSFEEQEEEGWSLAAGKALTRELNARSLCECVRPNGFPAMPPEPVPAAPRAATTPAAIAASFGTHVDIREDVVVAPRAYAERERERENLVGSGSRGGRVDVEADVEPDDVDQVEAEDCRE